MREQWTFSTFMIWVQSQIEGVYRVLEERAKAILVAIEALNKRFDGTNEWRGALDDQSKLMASKEELRALRERVEKVEAWILTDRGATAGASKSNTLVFGIIAAIGTLIGIVGIASRFLNG